VNVVDCVCGIGFGVLAPACLIGHVEILWLKRKMSTRDAKY